MSLLQLGGRAKLIALVEFEVVWDAELFKEP
jgi:hypothetical protein